MGYSVEANMNWIEEAAEEHLDDMRSIGSKRESYRKSLQDVSDIASTDEVSEIADWIIERIERDGRPPKSTYVKDQARALCAANGYDIPISAYIAR